MLKKKLLFVTLELTILLTIVNAAIQKPQLKWAKKGGAPYLMYGDYAGSPAVADLNNDGRMEVIWANYMIYVVDGATGNVVWNVYTGHDRRYTGKSDVGCTYPAVVVADLDADDDLEIITAHQNGSVAVYDHKGYFHNSVWPKILCPASEIRSLSVADLDGNGQLEILVGSTRLGADEHDWYILNINGQAYPGWPKTAEHHCNHGAFNQNIAIADIDNDERQEIFALADVFYINAFKPNGRPIKANSIYGNKNWNDIPTWLHPESELRGDGKDGEYFPKFSFSAPIVADVNRDKIPEFIIIGRISDPATRPATPLYHTPIMLEPDRTRFVKNGFDWQMLPVPKQLASSAPLCEDWRITKVCLPNPVAVDLDHDDFLEILFPASDGKMHAYWLDKTQHHQWPFWITNPSEDIIRFATEPAVADLDNDGLAEVIFGSWTPRDSQKLGKLHLLNHRGEVLYELTVPASNQGWNGITSAPTIANIDDDPDYELVVGTSWTGLCAYDLPGTAHARILWQTGQGNFHRTGSAFNSNATADLNSSLKPPLHFKLHQNYPNPFHESTTIRFKLAQPEHVKLEIFNVQGQRLVTLFEGALDVGQHHFQMSKFITQPTLSSGLYFCRLSVDLKESYIKMIVLN